MDIYGKMSRKRVPLKTQNWTPAETQKKEDQGRTGYQLCKKWKAEDFGKTIETSTYMLGFLANDSRFLLGFIPSMILHFM